MVVSNIISNPSRSTSIWTRVWRLGRYVWALDIGHENEKCLDAFGNGFFGTTPDQKIYEMQIAATAAKRSDNPVYHQILSWPENEKITPPRFRQIVQDYIEFYKLQDNQIISGLHQDTENFHIHFVVNRFDIERERMVQINNGFERFHAARFCCFLEDKYGYAPSENAAAYKIGEEIVLSDLYNVDSAGGHIDKKSVAFGSESAAQKVKKTVRSVLSVVNSWEAFLVELDKRDVILLPVPRGGLVYCYRKDSSDEITVAASRVSKSATFESLSQRFFDDFENHHARASDLTDALDLGEVAYDVSAPPQAAEEVTYARYSAPNANSVAVNDELTTVVDQLSTLFPTSHVLFDQPVRGAGARTHLLDRARGDSQALNKVELMSFAPNLENLLRRGRRLRMVPSVDTFDAHNNYALVGPAAALSDLQGRGLFPAVVQDDGETSRFVFLRVDAQEAERLHMAAAGMNCRIERNPAITIARRRALIRPEIDSVHLQPPSLLTQLVPPHKLQFFDKFQEMWRKLSGALTALKVIGMPKIAAMQTRQKLKSCLAQLDLSEVLSNLEGKADHVTKNRGSSVERGQFTSELQSASVRFGRVDRGVSGIGGSGERPGPDEADIGEFDLRDHVDEGIDFASDAAAGGTGARRKIGHQSAAENPEDLPGPRQYRNENQQDYADAGRDFAESGAVAQRAWNPILRTPARAEMTQAMRMFLCLKIAKKHGLKARWDNDNKDIVFQQNDEAAVLLRVMEHVITSESALDHGLLADLQAAMNLPFEILHSPDSETQEDLEGILASIPDIDDPSPEFDALDWEYSEVYDDDVYSMEQSVRRRPRSLIFEQDGPAVPELQYDTVRVGSLAALDNYDLSNTEELIFYVRNALDLRNASYLEQLSIRARRAGLSETVAPKILLAHDTSSAPHTLVLVLNPDPDFVSEMDDGETIVLQVRSGMIIGGADIDVSNLKDIIIHDPGTWHESEDPTAAADAVALLSEQLEAWLIPPVVAELPAFQHTDGDLAETLRSLRRDDDYDHSASM